MRVRKYQVYGILRTSQSDKFHLICACVVCSTEFLHIELKAYSYEELYSCVEDTLPNSKIL